MKCQNCRKPATLYVLLLLDGLGETPYHDGYYCDDHAAQLPAEGGTWNALEVLEKTEAPL